MQFLIDEGTTHDVKIAPTLIDTIDFKETNVVCAVQGYDTKALRKQREKQQPRQKFQINPIYYRTILIWIGIYIKSDT